MRFSAVTEAALLKAGWYEGRTVEESTVKNWYALEWWGGGYVYAFPAALKFLREFGGLKIFGPQTETWIDPLTAARQMDAPTWVYDEWLLDDCLFPIGVGNVSDCMLSIGLRGRIYAISQNSGGSYLLGETPEQGIESMVLGFDVNKPLILAEKDKDAAAIADAVERVCKFEST